LIRTPCSRCDTLVEAPESSIGTEIACPQCEATVKVMSVKDQRAALVSESLRDDRAREEFMRALSRRESKRLSPSTAGVSTPVEAAPHNNALLATRRLKDVSVYLLAFAYLLPLLALAPAVVLAVFGRLPGLWGVFSFLTGALLAVLCFVFFKWLSDAARALADFGDLARSIDSRLGHLQALHDTDDSV